MTPARSRSRSCPCRRCPIPWSGVARPIRRCPSRGRPTDLRSGGRSSRLARSCGVRCSATGDRLVLLAFAHGLAIWIGLGGYAGLTQRLAAVAGRSSPLFPQRARHAGSSSRIRSRPPVTTRASWRVMPRAWSSPPPRRSPSWSSPRSAGQRPELAYKLYVCSVRRGLSLADRRRLLRRSACADGPRRPPSPWPWLYVWTDWPINYVTFGMLPYFLGIPLALVGDGGVRPVPEPADGRGVDRRRRPC